MKSRLWHKQLLRFGIVGLCAALVYILAGLFLLNGIGMTLMAANIGAFFVSMTVSYLGQSLWSFEGKGDIRSLLKFIVLCVIALTTTMLISYVITERDMPGYWGILITAVVIPVISFIVQKLWVFQK